MDRYKRNYSRWILKLPPWARRNPLGCFIACMTIITGLLYMTGLAYSNIITEALDPIWLRFWGAFLMIGGLLKLFGNMKYSYPVEKLGCRYINIAALVFSGWVLATSGLRGTATVGLALILVVALEIRVAIINLIIKPLEENLGSDDAHGNS